LLNKSTLFLMKLRLILLMSAGIGVIWAIGADTGSSELEVLQKAYNLEQNKIDLTLAEFSLEAAEGVTPAEEVQDKIDRWLRDNGDRLQAQAELAAKLDHSIPLLTEPQKAPLKSSLDRLGTERLRELELLEGQRAAELRSRAHSAEDFQMLFDEWYRSDEGQAVFVEKTSLFSKSAGHQPFGTQTVVLEVPVNASPEELAVLAIEERIARRVEEIRRQNPDADPEKMQSLIAGADEEFEADHQHIAELMQTVRRAKLVETVGRLRAEVSLSGEASSFSK
jgi:hypothetical protein